MPTPIAKTSPQKTIPQRMSRKYILTRTQNISDCFTCGFEVVYEYCQE